MLTSIMSTAFRKVSSSCTHSTTTSCFSQPRHIFLFSFSVHYILCLRMLQRRHNVFTMSCFSLFAPLTAPYQNFAPSSSVSETAEDRHFQFGTQADHGKCQTKKEKLPHNGRSRGHVTHFFLNLGPIPVSGMDKARHYMQMSFFGCLCVSYDVVSFTIGTRTWLSQTDRASAVHTIRRGHQ